MRMSADALPGFRTVSGVKNAEAFTVIAFS